MRFSIIIPVYNVEKYIGKCLDSVAQQTFRDFEAIIIDDESPDNSMAIADLYLEQYPDIFRVIHQKNMGLGGARNTGVQAAQGEYLLFLDSDDYIDLDMLSILNQRVNEKPCDILVFDFVRVTVDGTQLFSPALYSTDSLECSEEDKNRIMFHSPAACNKLFRRSFYLECNVSFPEKLLYEDTITRIFMVKAKEVQRCTLGLYYYVQRPSSIMHSVSDRCLEIMQVVDSVYTRFVNEGLYAKHKNAIDASLIFSVLGVVNSVHRQIWDHPFQKTLVDYIANQFPDFHDNPFIGKSNIAQIDLLRNEEFGKNRMLQKKNRRKTRLLQIPLVSSLNKMRKKLVKVVSTNG